MVRGPLLYCLMYEPPGFVGTAMVRGGGQVSGRTVLGSGYRVLGWAFAYGVPGNPGAHNDKKATERKDIMGLKIVE